MVLQSFLLFSKKKLLYVLFLVCVFLNAAWNHENKVINCVMARAHGICPLLANNAFYNLIIILQ